MRYINLADAGETVSFREAVLRGIGRSRGLFFPARLPEHVIAHYRELSLVELSTEVLAPLVEPDVPRAALQEILKKAFDFPLPIVDVPGNRSAIELFHGPSLAFKDFGARFLAGVLGHFAVDRPLTVLTATSGDTGAAVAHAFFRTPHVRVVVLYPDGAISPLQEKLFCTLGENVTTVRVSGDFDACQSLVKQAFADSDFKEQQGLISANSINVARLIAQICYYGYASLRFSDPVTIAVPSGNFGNVTAGLMARAMGFPIRHLIAATNENDTVPRFMEQGEWSPNATVPTLSNAMDVANPNNFARVLHLDRNHGQKLHDAVSAVYIPEQEATKTVARLHKAGYLTEPHGAIGYTALDRVTDGPAAFLGTAHPAKFAEAVEGIIGESVQIPATLARYADRPVLSETIAPEAGLLRDILVET